MPVDEVPFGAYLLDEDPYVWAIGGARHCFSIVEVNMGIPPPRSITPCHPTHPSGSGNYVLDVGSFCDIVGERVNCCLWDVCDIVQVMFQLVWGFPALLFWVVWCFSLEMCPWVSCGWCINWYHILEEGMLVGFQQC